MEGKGNILSQLDTLLPAEYLDTFRRKSHFEPEMSLIFAVFEEGVACYQKYATDRSVRGERLFRKAEKWIQEKNTDWLFSFESICNSLELNPDYLRKGLRQWRETTLKELALTHRNVEDSRTAIAS